MASEGERRRLAAFTIIQNEPVFFPMWLRHYLRHLDAEDIWVIDHSSRGHAKEVLTRLQEQHGFHVIEIDYEVSFDHRWLRDVVNYFQSRLLELYRWVVFAEVDELVLPHPDLGMSLSNYVTRPLPDVVRCTGYEVVHRPEKEPALCFDAAPLLQQRRWWYQSRMYSKPLLARVPPVWHGCFHDADLAPPGAHPDLLLVHCHKIDFDYALERHVETSRRNWTQTERESGIAPHNHEITDSSTLAEWFGKNTDDETAVVLTPIPDDVRVAV